MRPRWVQGHPPHAGASQARAMKARGARGARACVGFWKRGPKVSPMWSRLRNMGMPVRDYGYSSRLTAPHSPAGPGREDRRPGPPPRDHHHRCLLHRHRAGEHRVALPARRPQGLPSMQVPAGWGLQDAGRCQERVGKALGPCCLSPLCLTLCLFGPSSPQEPFSFCKLLEL